MAFERVAALEDLWDGEMRSLAIRGKKLLLVKLDGQVYAYEDRCAHLGLSLGDGRLENGVITCKAHEYQYDARTGLGINPKVARIRSYPVALDGDFIAVDFSGER